MEPSKKSSSEMSWDEKLAELANEAEAQGWWIANELLVISTEVAQLEAKNESLKGDSEMLQAMLEADYQAFLDLTGKVDEHIEGYERACLCAVCRSYGD